MGTLHTDNNQQSFWQLIDRSIYMTRAVAKGCWRWE